MSTLADIIDSWVSWKLDSGEDVTDLMGELQEVASEVSMLQKTENCFALHEYVSSIHEQLCETYPEAIPDPREEPEYNREVG